MGPTARTRSTGSLTAREREILGLLATGLSGADIAASLVLSPETVRTHVRNAMAKLGATTRSQAVVMALQREEIATSNGRSEEPETVSTSTPAQTDALASLLDGVASLHDVDAACGYLSDEDVLSLRLAGSARAPDTRAPSLPESIPLGEGPLGRAALERRSQLIALDGGGGGAHTPMIAAPMIASGRLVGMLGISVRGSRPTERAELLLAQAFATRVADILAAGSEQAPARLGRARDRFRASWAATTGG